MNAVAFDTLKLARNLREKAKMSAEQAEGLADAIGEAVQGDIATKGDIKSLETSTASELRDARAEIRQAELRLEAKIEATKAEIIKWMFGTIGFQTFVIVGAVLAFARTIKP